MLASNVAGYLGCRVAKCDDCKRRDSAIAIIGYSKNGFNLCTDCALQLVRIITEDLCELLTAGGRHG